MKVKQDQFPIAIQAYNTRGSQELFTAEQVVYTQAQVDAFTSKYAGSLIKTRLLTEPELDQAKVTYTKYVKRRSPAVVVTLALLLLLIILAVIGFSTGWIQENLGVTI